MVGAAGAAAAAGEADAADAASAAGAAAAAELQATHQQHRWRTRSLWSYRLHSGGSGGGLKTSRSGASGGPEPADIEGAHSRAASARTRRAGVYALLDWDNLPAAPTGVRRGTSDGHGWIGSKAVEITGSRVGRAVIQD
jgi:hypothetical protein